MHSNTLRTVAGRPRSEQHNPRQTTGQFPEVAVKVATVRYCCPNQASSRIPRAVATGLETGDIIQHRKAGDEAVYEQLHRLIRQRNQP